MRILFALHQFFPESRAGVEVVTLGLAKELRRRGHETFVLAAKRSLPREPGGLRPYETEDYEWEGVPVRRVGRPLEGASRPFRLNYENPAMAEAARAHALEVRPDVVHAMHLQGLSASVVPAFKRLGMPVVFTAADFWTVCPVVDLVRHDGALCRGPEAHHCVRCIASRNPDPRVNRRASLPGPAVRAASLFSATPLARLSGALRQVRDVRERPASIRENIAGVDRFLFYTDLASGLLAQNGVGKDGIVSAYGIDSSGLSGAREERRDSRKLRLGFIGTLAPHKGPDLAVRALRSLPDLDATLDLYGSAAGYEGYGEGLRRLAAGDARISFRGAFSRGKIGRVYSGMDALVVPSRWYENAPGVILEAHAAGAPVIAADLGGMSALVRHEKDGLLFRHDDPQDLAKQMQRLATDRGLLQRLRDGIRPVKTVSGYAAELEQIYASLVAGTDAGPAVDGPYQEETYQEERRPG